MLPRDATTPDELLNALNESTDEMPLVPISVLLEAVGEAEARKLILVKTHEFGSRARTIESIVLQRAMRLLSPQQLRVILPKGIEIPSGTEDNPNGP